MNLEVFCSNTFFSSLFYWYQLPVAETYFSDILTELVSMATRRDLKDTCMGSKMERESGKKRKYTFFSLKLLNIKLSLFVKRATFHFFLENYECNFFSGIQTGDIFGHKAEFTLTTSSSIFENTYLDCLTVKHVYEEIIICVR